MRVEMDGNDPCRFWVTSESDSNEKYIVDLCEYPIGLDQDGNMDFNGVCGLTNARIHGCRDFIYRCEPMLKKPQNMGKVFRCKHLRCARDYAFKLLLPHLAKNRVNLPEDQTP